MVLQEKKGILIKEKKMYKLELIISTVKSKLSNHINNIKKDI